MQRAPLLCGWMSVAMFSSLGLPGLNGFIGEFLIFKGSFAIAASFTAVAVFGLLFTAVVFMRGMQGLFSWPRVDTELGFAVLRYPEKWDLVTVEFCVISVCIEFHYLSSFTFVNF